MMPVIRVSEETYARLKKYAMPFEDTPDTVIARALSALDVVTGEPEREPSAAQDKGLDGPKLPQRDFRVPLLVTLLDLGGVAYAKAVRERIEPLMAPKLSEGDFALVSTGDPRWWNAVCWERSDLVKEGLMKNNSPRGIWEISEEGKALAASYHRRAKGTDRMIGHGTLDEMARKYRETPRLLQGEYFLMVGDTVFQRQVAFNPVLLTKITELELAPRTFNCLRNEGMRYLGDVATRSEPEMLRLANFGRKSLSELKELLDWFGLELGMRLSDWPPEGIEALATAYQDATKEEQAEEG